MGQRLGVDDRVGDLIRLVRNQTAPNRVALRPEVFAFVIKAFHISIDYDPERRAVEAGYDAAVELRRACIERHGMTAALIADRFSAVLEQFLQHPSLIMPGAADDEIVRGGAPVLLQ